MALKQNRFMGVDVIRIDKDSGEALPDQLCDGLLKLIGSRLLARDRLPSVRQLAMQSGVSVWTVNEAYQRLKDPLKRAAYLCEMRGAPIEAENNTAMPAAFLMQQMQWREALEEAEGEGDLQSLDDALQVARRDLLADIEVKLDQAGDAPGASGQVRALMFIERFAHDVASRFEQLGQ